MILGKEGGRPQYSGQVQLVSAVEGNKVKDRYGQIHNMILSNPVPTDNKSTTINVRLAGSTQTEQRQREQLKPYAESLKTLLVANGAMFTGVASSELYKLEQQFKKGSWEHEIWPVCRALPGHVQHADEHSRWH